MGFVVTALYRCSRPRSPSRRFSGSASFDSLKRVPLPLVNYMVDWLLWFCRISWFLIKVSQRYFSYFTIIKLHVWVLRCFFFCLYVNTLHTQFNRFSCDRQTPDQNPIWFWEETRIPQDIKGCWASDSPMDIIIFQDFTHSNSQKILQKNGWEKQKIYSCCRALRSCGYVVAQNTEKSVFWASVFWA